MLQGCRAMEGREYTVEVTNLSSVATEKDVYDFFCSFGIVEHVEIVRLQGEACTAYITFRESHALESALLFNGASIRGQQVCISRWGYADGASYFWEKPLWNTEEYSHHRQASHASNSASTDGEAIALALEVVKITIEKGYELSRDVLSHIKEMNKSNHFSANVAAKVVDFSEKTGLAGKINEGKDKLIQGVEAVKDVDKSYHVFENVKVAAAAMGKATVTAKNAVLSSRYFSAGAVLISDAFSKAARVASDLGSHVKDQ